MRIKFKVFGEHGFYTNVVLDPSDLLRINPYLAGCPDVYLPYSCSF